MNDQSQTDALEAALLNRAKRLANAYALEGRHARERIIEEARDELRLREEREKLNAKALADRIFRQRIQAGEIKLQEELDRLKWSLAQSVMDQVKERLRQFVEDEAGYLPVLRQFLQRAVEVIEREELAAEVNARDLERLRPHWEKWRQDLASGKHLDLSPTPRECMGGVLVQSTDERIRIDNTFEGRMERLHDELYMLIMEHLFSAVSLQGAVDHG